MLIARGIRAQRLRLEPIAVAHAVEMFAILCDGSLYTWTGGTAPASLSELKARYARQAVGRSADGRECWLNWICRGEANGAVVGYVQATVSESECFVAWVIGSAWQCRGYATEATSAMLAWLRTETNLPMKAAIRLGHLASERVARKCGFEPSEQEIEGERVWGA